MKFLDIAIRFEWWCVAAAAVAGYGFAEGSWALFALLVLAPDLSMLGYLGGPRWGAIAYNALHILILPVVLLVAGLFGDNLLSVHVALIWIAHIAVDRAVGYGLKLPSGFQDTHLGSVGRENR